jgi:hypothetical protein
LFRNQDDELNLRLRRAGGKIWQDPSIKSWYSPRSDLSKLFHQYFQYGFWKVAVIRKHRLPASWRHLVPFGWLLLNCGLLTAMVVAKVSHTHEWFARVAILWLIMTALYIGASLVAGIFAARKHQWSVLPYMPAIFATFHLSYGLGFAAGMLRFRNHRDIVSPVPAAFAKLTR